LDKNIENRFTEIKASISNSNKDPTNPIRKKSRKALISRSCISGLSKIKGFNSTFSEVREVDSNSSDEEKNSRSENSISSFELENSYHKQDVEGGLSSR